MGDELLRTLVQEKSLKVSVAVVTQTARDAQLRHGLAPAAAALFAQGLAGGALLASLQKEDSRLNLQVECDGPVRGFFVDAAVSGALRGYVKNPTVDVGLAQGAFQWRGLLGNQGFLSVLRDQGRGEYYRSSVELTSMRLAEDLDHFFRTSEQVATRVLLASSWPEGAAAGVLVQAMPDGDVEALHALADGWSGKLNDLAASTTASAGEVLAALLPGAEVLARTPLRFECTCSKERAMNTLAAMGPDEVQSIIDTMGSTAVTCQFCGAKHEITLGDLFSLLDALGRPPPRN